MNETINLYSDRELFNKLAKLLNYNNTEKSRKLFNKIMDYAYVLNIKEGYEETISVRCYPSEIKGLIRQALLSSDIEDEKDYFSKAKTKYERRQAERNK